MFGLFRNKTEEKMEMAYILETYMTSKQAISTIIYDRVGLKKEPLDDKDKEIIKDVVLYFYDMVMNSSKYVKKDIISKIFCMEEKDFISGTLYNVMMTAEYMDLLKEGKIVKETEKS